MPGYDWLWWKAQLYQESLLDPQAQSPVGAAGIAQIMPATARQIGEAIGAGNPLDWEWAVEAGAYYMGTLRRFWSAPRSSLGRLRLAQASYNAGAGNLAKAQKKCGGFEWEEISACFVQVTGHHSKETLTYVERIAHWYGQLGGFNA